MLERRDSNSIAALSNRLISATTVITSSTFYRYITSTRRIILPLYYHFKRVREIRRAQRMRTRAIVSSSRPRGGLCASAELRG